MDPSVLNENEGCDAIQQAANGVVGGMGNHLSRVTVGRRFSSFFGTTLSVTYLLWCKLMMDIPLCERPGVIIIHLLWTLMFLKTYQTTSVLAIKCKVDEKTYRKYVWLVIKMVGAIDDVVSINTDDLTTIFYHTLTYLLLLSLTSIIAMLLQI